MLQRKAPLIRPPVGGQQKQGRPCIQCKGQVDQGTSLDVECTTGLTSQSIEATSEVLCSRLKPTPGFSGKEEEETLNKKNNILQRLALFEILTKVVKIKLKYS